MKTLTLLRHAKSGWDDPVARDFDRPLNAKGRRAAQLIGRTLRALTPPVDRVVASPAVRVVETLEAAAAGHGGDLGAEWDRRLYLASPATLLDVVHETPDMAAHLLVSGHNPGLEELVLMLATARDGDPLRAAVADKFPTASVASLTFAVDRWADVAAGEGTLARFVRPRDLDPTLGPNDD